MTKLILLFIRVYQIFLKRFFLLPDNCRFSPTCSQYTYQAIGKYGILHGSLLGLKRLLSCHA